MAIQIVGTPQNPASRVSPALPMLQSVRPLDQLRERIRYLHYSRRTEEAYVYWCRAFVRWHGLRHPAEMGGPEVEAFLSYLAGERALAPSSHRQALSALLFLYGKVLGLTLPWMTDIGRPQTPRRLPVVLSPQEVVNVLSHLEGEHSLLARLLYGTGLRIGEALQLRVKDIDFAHQALIVRRERWQGPRRHAAEHSAGSDIRTVQELPGACRRGHDHDLHACPEARRKRRCAAHWTHCLKPDLDVLPLLAGSAPTASLSTARCAQQAARQRVVGPRR